jgi:hypothetical protein
MRRLRLRTETIRELSTYQLGTVGGGAGGSSEGGSLQSACWTACPSQSCSYAPSCTGPNSLDCTLTTF